MKSSTSSEKGTPSAGASDESPDRDFAEAAAGAFVRHFNLPIVIVSPSGAVLWCTDSARRRLRPPLPVFLEGARIRFTGVSGSRGVANRLSSFSEERRHVLCGEFSTGLWVLISGWAETIRGERVFVLACRISDPMRSCEESGLGEQFRLTKGECAVVDRFARMEPPKEIAARLGVTIHTVRSHLKQIHAKVGVNSNTQLLQVVRAYCDG